MTYVKEKLQNVVASFIESLHNGVMKSIKEIFASIPRPRSVIARELGVNPKTVTAWCIRDSVPAGYWADLIKSCEKWGHHLHTEDLLKKARRRKDAK